MKEISMAEINSQNAWSKFKSLVGNAMGTKDISDAELKKFMKDADANGDGLFSLDEFNQAMLSYEEYMNLEDDYLEAFESIAKEDGEIESISEDDLKACLEETEEPSSAGGGGGPTGGGGPRTNQDGTQPDINAPQSVSHSDLEGKEVGELQNEKSGLLNDITSARNEKNAAISDAKQKTDSLKNDYENATKSFDDLLKTQEETDESAKEASQNVQDLNNQKSIKNGEISTQEGVVTEATTLVNTISSTLSSLQAPPQFITETVTNSDGTTSTVQKENPDYQAYLEQKAQLEADLKSAESDLKTQEEILTSFETELTTIETNHKNAVDEYCKIKESLGQLTPAIADAQKSIQDTKTSYNTAQTEESTISSQYDAQIDILRNNLNVYDDVITQKETNVPEGYSIINGQIVGGEGEDKHTLTPVGEEDLPEGAVIDESNIIRDADGNEIGRVVGAEGSNPQIYIKEAPPIDPRLINICADMLLNGHNLENKPATADEVWQNINDNGLEFDKMNSADIAKIRDVYNQKVAIKNAQEGAEQLKSFDEKAAEMLENSNPDALEHIIDAGTRADKKDSEEQTFSEYIKENGVDVANTSQVILDRYLNDYVNEKTGTETKYDLSDEKIDEVVTSLVDGAQLNGEPISASELMKNYDFESLSSESVAKIIQGYNEKSETSFNENIDNFELKPEEFTHITESLVNSLNSNDENLVNSSTEVLNEIIDKSLSENSSEIIDTIINSADNNLAQVQKLISNGDLINKIDTSSLESSIKTELTEKLDEISKKEVTPEKLEKFNQDGDMIAVAHRGFSSEAPENTLAAIELAKENGYNAVELDISWTKDGVPVLLHDDTISRTSNGPNAKCSNMNYQDLLQYDFGSWAGDQFANTKIPTFSEALNSCAENKMEFYAELKDTKDFTDEKAQKLVDEVIKAGMQDNITWISFDKKALATIEKAMDNANLNSKLGYLTRDSVNNNTINTLNSLKDDNNEVFLDIKAANLTESGAKKLEAAGYDYGVWTVNSEKDLDRLAKLGCSAVTTDKLKQEDIERL